MTWVTACGLDKEVPTSANKQVAPTPREARLRGTPAHSIAEPGNGPDIVANYGFVGPCGRAGVATLERYTKGGLRKGGEGKECAPEMSQWP